MPLKNFEQFIENIDRFDFEGEQEKIIESHKDKLADLQAEQWAQSKDSEGKEIKLLDNAQYGFGYRPFTVSVKRLYGRGLGAVTDRVTLFQTGEMYKTLFATITSGEFFLSSPVPYFKELMERTGDPTGLDYDEKIKFAETYTIPEYRQVLKAKTGLTF